MAHMGNTEGRSTQEPLRHRLSPGIPPEQLVTAFLAVLVLAVWEWGSRTGRISTLFFPPPSATVRALRRLLSTGRLGENLGATLYRVFVGFGLGAAPGLVLGLVSGWSRQLRAVVDPFIAAAHPIPKVAILPLVMIILGIGESSKLAVVAIACFFPMLINAMAAVREIPPIYFEVAENYGADLRRVFSRVVAPATLPLAMSGVRLSLNTALVLTLAVELVAAQRGLGAMMWLAWETLRTADLYATLTVTAILGIGFNLIVQALERYLIPWHAD